ncbi:ParB N-terminal domain-containing protein [Micromonospora sp. WMMC273]|uniref:ParB N-terminal domain-containing protein n=1 Tax=Micromonospora sp. WMMC273 TaxID=3015157 RepID=UPI0022B7207E|nr:ParB N-terminal domain-containing protein [Micromonospora sp. WMMC273]MCZ7478934.1 ParB N-terminal domain-containing protein [Micromonospora sp. WMMC273]MCZ7478995.1 ParB N-terminal domain-containing protein [Micromonospora sp. WMMC273]
MPRDLLSANNWNPNKAAPPEQRLLKTSILENGWTQPIVVREFDGGQRLEIVDGYHRWMTSADPEVRSLTDGYVPIVRLPECPEDLAIMATVRHNRARGTHHVLGMADLVDRLLSSGLSREEMGRRLGMDAEEVDRLADRGQMTKRGAAAGFNTGWTV